MSASEFEIMGSPLISPMLCRNMFMEGKPPRSCNDFVAAKGFVFQEAALLPVQPVMGGKKIIGC